MSFEIRGYKFFSDYFKQPQCHQKIPISEIVFIDTEVGTRNILIRSEGFELEFLNINEEEQNLLNGYWSPRMNTVRF